MDGALVSAYAAHEALNQRPNIPEYISGQFDAVRYGQTYPDVANYYSRYYYRLRMPRYDWYRWHYANHGITRMDI